MKFFDESMRLQEVLILTGIFVIFVIPLWVVGLKSGGMENLLPNYIIISTALMAIIFAALAIQNKKEIFVRLAHPLYLSSLALGTSIYTLFLIQMNSTPSVLTQVLFSVATMFLFAAILEIHIMTYQSYKMLRRPKEES